MKRYLKENSRIIHIVWIAVLLVCLFVGTLFAVRIYQSDNRKLEYSENSNIELYFLTDNDLAEELSDGYETIDLSETDGFVKIEHGGDYQIVGRMVGQIAVDAKDELVHLVLSGVEVNSSSGPALWVQSAGKVVVTIPEGTESYLNDSAYYQSFENSEACIYSSCDLSINGKGTLYVSGVYKDAIRSKDVVKLIDTNVYVKAKEVGIRGNDGVVALPSYLEIQSEKSGIYTKKHGKKNKGYVDLGRGNISIISGRYAIDAAGDLQIHDCLVAMYGVLGNIRSRGKESIVEGCIVQ